MKSLFLGFAVAVALQWPGSSQAQSYSIDWYKVAGGGGTSTGGAYQISGTVGQSDAGPVLSGGNYSLTGGFWALYALQTAGAPGLRIYLSSPSSAVVAWLAPATGFVLQENSNLNSPNWINSAAAVATIHGTNQVTITPPAGNKLFRLYHP